MSDSPTQSPRKSLFDAVRAILGRAILGRGFRRSGGGALNPSPDPVRHAEQPVISLLDSVSCVQSVPRVRRTEPLATRRIGPEGTALIRQFEGCAKARRDGLVAAYPDPGTGGEPWTIGWGATGADHVHGGRIGPGTVWTQAQCDARLADDLVRYARDVTRAIGDAPTTQSQFDALVSFHYNTGAIARATLTKKHRTRDYEGAAAEFRRWNKAGGRVLKGLVRRRAAEERLYRGE